MFCFFVHAHLLFFLATEQHEQRKTRETEKNPPEKKKWYPTSFRASLLRTHYRTRRVPSLPPPTGAQGFAAASNKKSVVCNGTKTNVINGRRLLQFIPYTPGPPTIPLPTERGLRSKATPSNLGVLGGERKEGIKIRRYLSNLRAGNTLYLQLV